MVEEVVGEHLRRRYGEVHILAGKREVDFVVGRAGIEVKWQERVDAKDFPRVGLRDKILLCKEGVRYVEKGNLAIVPVPLFLLGISPLGVRGVDSAMKELGVCPDCEEVFGAEEDYWGWREEEEW